MKQHLQLIIDFLTAVLCGFVLASLFHSQFVMHRLTELGINIDLSTRISSSLKDMMGLLPTYGVIILLALLAGFTLTGLVRQYYSLLPNWLYPLSGATAIAVALLAMQPILDITLIAGARGVMGFAAQCLAGLFAGWVFMYQRKTRQIVKRNTQA